MADAAGKAGRVKWNFEKFVIQPDGEVLRFRPATQPDDPAVDRGDRARTRRGGRGLSPIRRGRDARRGSLTASCATAHNWGVDPMPGERGSECPTPTHVRSTTESRSRDGGRRAPPEPHAPASRAAASLVSAAPGRAAGAWSRDLRFMLVVLAAIVVLFLAFALLIAFSPTGAAISALAIIAAPIATMVAAYYGISLALRQVNDARDAAEAAEARARAAEASARESDAWAAQMESGLRVAVAKLRAAGAGHPRRRARRRHARRVLLIRPARAAARIAATSRRAQSSASTETGRSMQRATNVRNAAASAPSQTRWSNEIVSSVTVRTASCPSTTHGRSTSRPMPSIAASGWLMIAAEPSTPSVP